MPNRQRWIRMFVCEEEGNRNNSRHHGITRWIPSHVIKVWFFIFSAHVFCKQHIPSFTCRVCILYRFHRSIRTNIWRFIVFSLTERVWREQKYMISSKIDTNCCFARECKCIAHFILWKLDFSRNKMRLQTHERERSSNKSFLTGLGLPRILCFVLLEFNGDDRAIASNFIRDCRNTWTRNCDSFTTVVRVENCCLWTNESQS